MTMWAVPFIDGNFSWDNPAAATPDSFLYNGDWHHYAITYKNYQDGDLVAGLAYERGSAVLSKIYYDGKVLAYDDSTYAGSLGTTTKPFMIGRSENGNDFCRNIDPHVKLVDYKPADGKPKYEITQRDKEWEDQVIGLLEKQGLKRQFDNVFLVEHKHHQYDLVSWINENATFLKENDFLLEQGLDDVNYFTGPLSITVSFEEKNDWFDVHAIAQFGEDYKIPVIALRKYLLNGIREYKLPDGRIAILPEEWFNKYKGTIESYSGFDCWEGYNEPVVKNPDEMRWYSDFEIERMKLLESIGRKACIGNFAVGNPELDLWEDFSGALNYATRNGHYLALHEYGNPSMQTDSEWLSLRHRKVYNQYGLTLPLVITETGIDKGGGEDDGWKNTGISTEEYFNQLVWYDSELQKDSYVIGAAIYQYGFHGWESFDISPLAGENGKLTQYLQQSNLT